MLSLDSEVKMKIKKGMKIINYHGIEYTIIADPIIENDYIKADAIQEYSGKKYKLSFVDHPEPIPIEEIFNDSYDVTVKRETNQYIVLNNGDMISKKSWDGVKYKSRRFYNEVKEVSYIPYYNIYIDEYEVVGYDRKIEL